MIKIGMLIGDRYEILEKIGTGGMSDVYKAKCHKLNRFVAIKVLKQEFNENTNFDVQQGYFQKGACRKNDTLQAGEVLRRADAARTET